jgi:uncharacterized protein (TIGR03437 family)
VMVSMTIGNTPQTMVLGQTGLTFTAVQSGGVSPPQDFHVLNTGQGSMPWSTMTRTFSGASGLFSIAPTAGISNANEVPAPLIVTASTSGVAPGAYYGQITVTSPTAANSPQTNTVVLNVLPADQNPGPVVQPSGLYFTTAAGAADPDAQSFVIANLSPSPILFNSNRTFVPDGNWFVHDPISGTIPGGGSATIAVRPQTRSLRAGVYRAVISLAFSDGSIRSVAIKLVVAGSMTDAGLTSRDATPGCTPTRWEPLFTTLPDTFSAQTGWPTPLVVKVFDDCANPMTSGSLTVSFSNGDAPMRLNSLNDGRWTGTWTPSRPAKSAVLTALAETSSPALSGMVTISGAAVNNPDPPVVPAGGVLNAAMSTPGMPLAPGSLISIYGLHLANSTTTAPSLPLETSLQGVQVALAGELLSLAYTSDGQINAVVPYDLEPNASHNLVVLRGVPSVPVQVQVASAQPAVFATTGGQGIIVDPDGQLYAPGHPAHATSVAVIYCTGLGAVTGDVKAGSPAPFDPPATTVLPVFVTIGGKSALVMFKGLTPGFAGLYQVNVVVPDGISPGDAVNVVLTVNGLASAPVTMSIQ